MPRTLRYTTFKPGELEARLRELAPGSPPTSEMLLRSGVGRGLPRQDRHTFCVRFPDGQSGECRYERGGPRWHLFYFTYVDGAALPRQVCLERQRGDPATIESKGQELAGACYREAVVRERKEYFQRASEPSDGSRKRRPDRYRLKPASAKEQAGRYALALRSGNLFLVQGPLCQNIEGANALWREKRDPRYVVVCCNRLDRCWELPRYNPLYGEADPRPAFAPSVSAKPGERT